MSVQSYWLGRRSYIETLRLSLKIEQRR